MEREESEQNDYIVEIIGICLSYWLGGQYLIYDRDDDRENIKPSHCSPLREEFTIAILQWRHNEHDGVSNHQSYEVIQPFIQTKENIKTPRHWPLYGEFTGNRWIPRTNGQ